MDRVRRIDLPARIGGDEFVVICPETAKPAARLVAERIRSGIESLQDSKGKPLDITASIGVASFSRRRQPARRSSAARRPHALRSQIPRKEPRLQLGRLRGRWRRQELPGIGPPYSRRPDHRKARRERNDQLVPSRTETRILFTFWSKKISPQRRRVRGEENGCLDLWLGSDFPGSSSALSASLRFKSFQVYLASP